MLSMQGDAQSSLIGIFNPFDVGDWMGKSLGWIIDQFDVSYSKGLENTIKVIDHAPTANLTSEWYRLTFGSSLLVVQQFCVMLVCLMALAMMLSPRRGSRNLIQAFKNTVLLCLWGQIFFFIIQPFGLLLINGLTKMAKVIATMGQSDGDWVERLTGSLAGQNPLDGFLMGIIGWIFGFFLALEVMMVQAGLYFAGLLTVFTIWLRDMGKMGPRLWRWTISLGIAAAFTKPLMIFFLAAGSTLIAHLPDSIQGTSSIPISIFSVILAWASPLILFFAANYKLIKGETRSQIEGEIDTNSRSTDVTPTAIASQGGAMQPIQVTVMSAAPGGPPSRNVGPGLATIMGVQATRAGVMTATRAAGSVGGPIGAVALVAGTATDKYLKNKTEK